MDHDGNASAAAYGDRLPCRMAVVLPGPSPFRGSHGRLPTSDDNRPLVLLSTPAQFPAVERPPK